MDPVSKNVMHDMQLINKLTDDLKIIKNDLNPSRSLGRKFVRKLESAIQKIIHFFEVNHNSKKRFTWESKQVRRFNELTNSISKIRNDFDHSKMNSSDLEKVEALIESMQLITSLFGRHNKVDQSKINHMDHALKDLLTQYKGSIATHNSSSSTKSSHETSEAEKTQKLTKKKETEKIKKQNQLTMHLKKQKMVKVFIQARMDLINAGVDLKIPRANQDEKALMEANDKDLLQDMTKFSNRVLGLIDRIAVKGSKNDHERVLKLRQDWKGFTDPLDDFTKDMASDDLNQKKSPR